MFQGQHAIERQMPFQSKRGFPMTQMEFFNDLCETTHIGCQAQRPGAFLDSEMELALFLFEMYEMKLMAP